MNRLEQDVSCPACGEPHLEIKNFLAFPSKGGMRLPLMQCGACGHSCLGTDARQQDEIDAGYAHDYAGHRVDPVFALRLKEALREEIVPLKPPPGSLLDVGCGNGQFLEAANTAGYSVRGIDISEDAVARCRAMGFEAHVADFFQDNGGEKFDIVSFWDVFEHLRDPSSYVSRAKSLLKPGGLILSKTPGFGPSLIAATRVAPFLARTALSAPEHIQYFTRLSFSRLLARHGATREIWFPSRGFRSRPEGGSMKRRLSRIVSAMAMRATGSQNLFVAAQFD